MDYWAEFQLPALSLFLLKPLDPNGPDLLCLKIKIILTSALFFPSVQKKYKGI